MNTTKGGPVFEEYHAPQHPLRRVLPSNQVSFFRGAMNGSASGGKFIPSSRIRRNVVSNVLIRPSAECRLLTNKILFSPCTIHIPPRKFPFSCRTSIPIRAKIPFNSAKHCSSSAENADFLFFLILIWSLTNHKYSDLPDFFNFSTTSFTRWALFFRQTSKASPVSTTIKSFTPTSATNFSGA